MRLRVQTEARRDLLESACFYERQSSGWGDYFLDCLETDINNLPRYAGIHPTVSGGLRRVLSEKFQHAIYYKIMGVEISVSAVVDCRRDPAWIRRRLDEKER